VQRRRVRIVIVYWLDPFKSSRDECNARGVVQCSAGVLVRRTRRFLKLSQICDVFGDCREPFRDVLTIPAQNVLHCEVLVPKAPARRLLK
jgi:hypothetical protein